MPEPHPPASRPRVALVGTSGYGAIHLQELVHLRDTGRIDLVACVTVDAGQQSGLLHALAGHGCQIHADFESMLQAQAGRLDLCCLPTPISCHMPMTLAALKAGANVLVEKPLAASPVEAETIIQAERRSGRFVAVGYQDFYQPENLRLKHDLFDGAIGRLKEIRLCAVHPRPLSYYRRNQWAGRIHSQGLPVNDSPINNAFAHFLNLALFFAGSSPLGSATPLRTEAGLFRAQPIENFDTAVVHCETSTGVALKIYATHSCEAPLPLELLFEGEAGTVRWTNNGAIRIITAKADQHRVLPDPLETRRRMFDAVIRRLTDPSVSICRALSAAGQVQLVNLVQASSPIRDIPPTWLKRTKLAAPGDEQISIPGIEAVFRDAFARGLRLHEMGCDWAAS